MKKITILLILLLLLSVSVIKAQNPYPIKELAESVLSRKLVVQLTDETSETFELQNKAIKTIFKENWKLTEVKFLSKQEIEKLIQAKEEEYTFLTFDDGLLSDVREGYISSTGLHKHGVGDFGSAKFDYTAFTFSYFNYKLSVIKKGRLTTVTEIGFANGELFKTDYMYLCQQLTNLISSSAKGIKSSDFYNTKKNIADLKNNTLILLEDLFKEKYRSKVGTYYKYNYELVDKKKLEDIIMNKEQGKYYAKIIWSNQHNMYVWVTVDAADGSIKSILAFGGVKFGKHHDANEIIHVKHLKYLTSLGGQKMNNKYK